MPRTKYMNKELKEQYNLSQYPNAGPNANITGMKKMFYGKDALLVKSGQYIYHVPKEVYDAAY